jgi:hypothetical protein
MLVFIPQHPLKVIHKPQIGSPSSVGLMTGKAFLSLHMNMSISLYLPTAVSSILVVVALKGIF